MSSLWATIGGIVVVVAVLLTLAQLPALKKLPLGQLALYLALIGTVLIPTFLLGVSAGMHYAHSGSSIPKFLSGIFSGFFAGFGLMIALIVGNVVIGVVDRRLGKATKPDKTP